MDWFLFAIFISFAIQFCASQGFMDAGVWSGSGRAPICTALRSNPR